MPYVAPLGGSGTSRIAARQFNLDRIGWIARHCRDRLVRHHHDRHQVRRRHNPRRFVKLPAPGKHLIGVHVVPPRHHGHRRSRQQCRRDDLPLERLRPGPVPPFDPQTCVHHLVRGHFRSRPSYKRQDRPSNRQPAVGGPRRRETAKATGLRPGARDGLGQLDIAFQLDGADSDLFLAQF